MRTIYFLFLTVFFMAGAIPEARAGDVSGTRRFNFWEKRYDVWHPKTKEEIYNSFRIVNVSDGISQAEARLIAQYAVATTDIKEDYDFTKPWIIAEDKTSWILRFPAKYSLTQQGKTPERLVVVDKRTGLVSSLSSNLK